MGSETLCIFFTDDTKIIGPVKSQSQKDSTLENLNKVNKWSGKWQLPFNSNKCKVQHVRRSNTLTANQMSGIDFQEVQEQKDLGMVMDSELKFHKHVSAAARKTNQELGIIKRTETNLIKDILPEMYLTWIDHTLIMAISFGI